MRGCVSRVFRWVLDCFTPFILLLLCTRLRDTTTLMLPPLSLYPPLRPRAAPKILLLMTQPVTAAQPSPLSYPLTTGRHATLHRSRHRLPQESICSAVLWLQQDRCAQSRLGSEDRCRVDSLARVFYASVVVLTYTLPFIFLPLFGYF